MANWLGLLLAQPSHRAVALGLVLLAAAVYRAGARDDVAAVSLVAGATYPGLAWVNFTYYAADNTLFSVLLLMVACSVSGVLVHYCVTKLAKLSLENLVWLVATGTACNLMFGLCSSTYVASRHKDLPWLNTLDGLFWTVGSIGLVLMVMLYCLHKAMPTIRLYFVFVFGQLKHYDTGRSG